MLDDACAAGMAFVSPACMGEYLTPGYEIPPHVRYLSEALADGIPRGGARIVVTMPPRHGKSETCSLALPVWFLAHNPHKRVLVASYGDSFAARWGRRARNAIEEKGAGIGVAIAPDSSAAHEWDTTAGGGMTTAGVGGGITGRGFHLAVVDDPHKDAEEASSETMQERAWEWWTQTFLTRLEPGGSVVVVLTRWHEGDLAGRILAQDGADSVWTRINFPAVAEDHDALGRAPGEALWPARYPVEALDKIRTGPSSVGSRAWAALYQQRPSPAGGGMFRDADFRYWSRGEDGAFVLHHGDGNDERVQPHQAWRAQTCDTAMKVKTVNDWTVVLTYAVTAKRQLILLDCVRQRIEVPDQLPLIRAQRAKWKPRWTAVEDKASGTGIVQEARRQGVALRPLKAVADKVTRAAAAAVLYENHAVFHPLDAAWLADYEHELKAFPNGAHDDQVDCIAHAVNELAPQARYGATAAPREESLTGMAQGDFRW